MRIVAVIVVAGVARFVSGEYGLVAGIGAAALVGIPALIALEYFDEG